MAARPLASYTEPSDWQWLVDELRARGLDARVARGFLQALSVEIDLGDGWSCSVTTSSGDLRAYDPREDEIAVYVGGPGVPHEGYRLDWFPPTETLKRLPRAIVPLLERMAVGRPAPAVSPPVGEALTVDNADEMLRAMLGSATDLHTAWEVFARFAAITIDGLDPARDEDLLLFESVPDAGQRPAISLVRQFMLTGQDERDADPDARQLVQLTCELRLDPTAELVDAFRDDTAIWGQSGSASSDWLARVEGSKPFRVARDTGTPVTVDVRQSLV